MNSSVGCSNWPGPADPGMVPRLMFPADRKPTPAAVEYDSPTGRTVRYFLDAYSARRFYTDQDRQGKAPKVLRSETMATKKAPVVKSDITATKSTKKATKKATTKKSPAAKKATTPTMANAVKEYGMTRSHDVAWNEAKCKVFSGMHKLGATSPTSARSAVDIAGAAGIPTYAVRHYCYHAAAAGLTAVCTLEGTRGYAFHLTAKGKAVDLKKVLA